MTQPVAVPLSSQEPLDSVLRVLQLTESGDDIFEAHSLPQVRRVYGGQVLAQGLLAASATMDKQRLPHSLHAYFLRGGDPSTPYEIKVSRLRDGRSFSSRHILSHQGGRELFSMICSFQAYEEAHEFATTAPDVPCPETLTSAFEIFRAIDHPVGRFLGKTTAFDIRHVQESLYTKADPTCAPVQQLWMSPRSPVPTALSQFGHRALLTYVIDQVMLEPAIRALGCSWMTEGMSVASIDHAMWFHKDININQWYLYDCTCSSITSGRVLTQARVFSRDGVLVAEATQQGMLRLPHGSEKGSGRWGFKENFGTGAQEESLNTRSSTV